MGCSQSAHVTSRPTSPARPNPTRAAYLIPLHEYIGRDPRRAKKPRSWEDEWDRLQVAFYETQFMGSFLIREGGGVSTPRELLGSGLYNSVTGGKPMHDSLADFKARHIAKIQRAVDEAGWSEEDATVAELLTRRRQPLADALHEAAIRVGAIGDGAGEGDEGNRRRRRHPFAASTYALCESLFRIAAQQQKTMALAEEDAGASSSVAASLAGMKAHRAFYKHLYGTFSLEENDDNWEYLLKADAEGFCGLTSFAATEVNLELEHNFQSHEGFAQRVTVDNQSKYLVQNSPVVQFVVAPEDERGMHAPAVFASGDVAVFPPNTLFELIEQKKPGEWTAPNGVKPRQPLYVVRATFQNPLEKEWRGSSGTLLIDHDALGLAAPPAPAPASASASAPAAASAAGAVAGGGPASAASAAASAAEEEKFSC